MPLCGGKSRCRPRMGQAGQEAKRVIGVLTPSYTVTPIHRRMYLAATWVQTVSTSEH